MHIRAAVRALRAFTMERGRNNHFSSASIDRRAMTRDGLDPVFRTDASGRHLWRTAVGPQSR